MMSRRANKLPIDKNYRKRLDRANRECTSRHRRHHHRPRYRRRRPRRRAARRKTFFN